MNIIKNADGVITTAPTEEQKQLSPENVLAVQHQEWLKHPVTIQLVRNITKHKQHLVTKLSSSAGNTTEDAWFHRTAMAIKTTQVIHDFTVKTEQFVEASTK